MSEVRDTVIAQEEFKLKTEFVGNPADEDNKQQLLELLAMAHRYAFKHQWPIMQTRTLLQLTMKNPSEGRKE